MEINTHRSPFFLNLYKKEGRRLSNSFHKRFPISELKQLTGTYAKNKSTALALLWEQVGQEQPGLA